MSDDPQKGITMANGGDVHLKAGDGGIHGNGGNLEINGGVGGVTIKGGDGGTQPTEYPGGVTWVDREYDPYFMELPPDEKFHRLKALGRWLKEHVLAAVLIGSILAVLSTILVFYTNQWLGQHQEKSLPPLPPAKAMPV